VAIMYHPRMGVVQQFCIVTASCVCWVCWLRSHKQKLGCDLVYRV